MAGHAHLWTVYTKNIILLSIDLTCNGYGNVIIYHFWSFTVPNKCFVSRSWRHFDIFSLFSIKKTILSLPLSLSMFFLLDPFTAEYLKQTIPTLNLLRTIVPNRVSVKTKTEWQTEKILMKRHNMSQLVRIYTVRKNVLVCRAEKVNNGNSSKLFFFFFFLSFLITLWTGRVSCAF